MQCDFLVAGGGGVVVVVVVEREDPYEELRLRFQNLRGNFGSRNSPQNYKSNSLDGLQDLGRGCCLRLRCCCFDQKRFCCRSYYYYYYSCFCCFSFFCFDFFFCYN